RRLGHGQRAARARPEPGGGGEAGGRVSLLQERRAARHPTLDRHRPRVGSPAERARGGGSRPPRRRHRRGGRAWAPLPALAPASIFESGGACRRARGRGLGRRRAGGSSCCRAWRGWLSRGGAPRSGPRDGAAIEAGCRGGRAAPRGGARPCRAARDAARRGPLPPRSRRARPRRGGGSAPRSRASPLSRARPAALAGAGAGRAHLTVSAVVAVAKSGALVLAEAEARLIAQVPHVAQVRVAPVEDMTADGLEVEGHVEQLIPVQEETVVVELPEAGAVLLRELD